jgi:sodium-dependent dicarboxylate transporter 2/3/5
LAGGIALFVIPAGDNKSRLLDWRTAKRFPIDILVLIGGGLALAAAIEENGLALWIAQLGARIGDWPFSLLLLSVLCLVIGLAEFTSNTATVASLLPVASALAATLNLPPLPLTIAVGLGGSCGFMLPVSTPPNAIVYGTGRVPLSFMVRTGFLMNLAACAILWVWLAWLAPYQNLGD